MDYFINPQFISVAVAVITFGYTIGRYTKILNSVEHYNKTLAILTKKIRTAGEQKSIYISYSESIKTIGKILLILCGFLVVFLYYFKIMLFNKNPEQFY